SSGPLERVGGPRVVTGDRARSPRPDGTDDEHKDAGRENERANRGDEIQRSPTSFRQIGVDASRHAVESELMHRKEDEIEADEHQPKIPTPRALAQHVSRPLRKPVIERAEKWKHGAANQHVVKMGDDEKRVVYLQVERH